MVADGKAFRAECKACSFYGKAFRDGAAALAADGKAFRVWCETCSLCVPAPVERCEAFRERCEACSFCALATAAGGKACSKSCTAFRDDGKAFRDGTAAPPYPGASGPGLT